ncbi:hypothetical protein GQ457_13G013010 [Hibiscus cannabinus]
MDRLSQAIQASVSFGRWRPIQLTRSGPPLSHLFFADDMVLFAEAIMDQVGVIRDILSDFCKASGHKVSISKTQLCFSRNCAPATKSLIAGSFGFEVVEDLGKYLGVPLLHKRVTHATNAYVLDDMRARLSGWAAQSLSLAGRITLAKSVLQSIPIYVMQATWLPKGVCQEMEKLIRKFVWGGSNDRPGVALLPWGTVQRSPAQGGLGLKDLHDQNKAFLMKIGHSLLTDDDRLWVQVLKTKYNWTEVLPLDIKHTPCSRLWTGISNIWEDLKECISWDIRDGSTTDFWYDHWLGEEERLAFACLLPNPPRPMLVADMVCGTGDWDWRRIEHALPREMVERIATVQPPVALSEVGEWRRIWKLSVPQRIRVFVWLVFHDLLLTNVERHRRHMTNSNLCELCGDSPESVDHVLRSCAMVRNVWLRSIPMEAREVFFTLPIKAWLCKNLFEPNSVTCDEDWPIRFAILCWLLWKRRCCLVLGSGESFRDDVLVCGDRMVRLNVDASVTLHDNRAGVGRVIRDAQGRWVFGFYRFLGRCDSLVAEMWAIHDGLLQAWDLGYTRIELESDCLEAVLIIHSESSALAGSALVSSIKEVMGRGWTVVVKHVGRGSNRVADFLAAQGRNLVAGGMRLSEPPVALVSLLEEEFLGPSSSVGEATGVG